MPVYLYKEIKVSGSANTETSDRLLTVPEGVTYHIDALLPTEVTGTLQHDATLRAWIEREKILEADIRHTLGSSGSNTRYEMPWLPVEHEMVTGETLTVGQESGGTASDMKWLVKFHEV